MEIYNDVLQVTAHDMFGILLEDICTLQNEGADVVGELGTQMPMNIRTTRVNSHDIWQRLTVLDLSRTSEYTLRCSVSETVC